MKKFNRLNVVSTAFLALFVMMLTPNINSLIDANAATTDIATVPIFTSNASANAVKPNIMMILDNSLSMELLHMPDTVGDFSKADGNPSASPSTVGVPKYGYTSSQCNGIYYNPTFQYKSPIHADGSPYPDATFSAAWDDGYKQTGSTTNLSTSFKSEATDTPQSAYYYVYSGTLTSDAQRDYSEGSAFYKECASVIDSEAIYDGQGHKVKDVFTKHVLSTTSGTDEERQNFANWYSYYRNRMLMMKTSTGLAFDALDDKFRVGFMVINDDSTNNFLDIKDYTSTQKTNWYDKLYTSFPVGQTPTRAALSKAGRLYAGITDPINGVTPKDPVQYACQKNYTILSTDGYWTSNQATANAVDSQGGKKLDGSEMDSQDSLLPRPFYDGTKVTYQKSTSQLTKLETRYTSTASHVTEKDTQTQRRRLQLQQKDTDSRVNQNTTQYQKRQNGYGSTTYVMQMRQDSYTKTTKIRQQMQKQLTKTVVPWKQRTVTYTKVVNQQQKQTQKFYRCNNENLDCQAISFDCRIGGTQSGSRPNCKFDAASAWTNSQCTAGDGIPVTYCRDLAAVTTTTYGLGSCVSSAMNSSGTTTTCTISDVTVDLAAGSTCTNNSSTGVTCSANNALSTTTDVSSCSANSSTGTSCAFRDTTWVDLAAGTACNTNTSTGLYCQDKSGSGVVTTVYPCTTDASIGVSCVLNTGSWVDLPAGTPCVTDSATGKFCQIKSGSGVSVVGACTPNASTGVTCGYISGTGAWFNVSKNNTDKCVANTSTGIECQSINQGTGLVVSCTASDPVGGPTVTCTALPPPSWVNTGTCNAGTVGTITTTCQIVDVTSPAWTNRTTCTPNAMDATGLETQCRDIDPNTPAGWYGVASCTPKTAALNGGKKVECNTVIDPSVEVATCACTAGVGSSCNATATASTTPAWTGYLCENKVVIPATGVPSCTNEAASAGNNNITSTCNTVAPGAVTVGTCTASPASASNNYVATTCSAPSFEGGTTNTLADTAAYYYYTNLRATNCHGDNYDPLIPATDRCLPNKVVPPQNGDITSTDPEKRSSDPQTSQHMTTYTVGLGASGNMIYSKNYKQDSLDYSYINTATNKSATTCSWLDEITKVGGECNWPDTREAPPPPIAGAPLPIADLATIDDLWHAAVNGHGVYFSAKNPSDLQTGLSKVLDKIQEDSLAGTSASSAAASPKISVSNDKLYSSYFKANEWSGELISQTVNINTGAVKPYDPSNPPTPPTDVYNWSAQHELDAICKPKDTANGEDGKDCVDTANRKVYTSSTPNNAGTNGLIEFTWDNVKNDSYLANYFKVPHISTSPPGPSVSANKLTGLTQFCNTASNCLSTNAQTHFTATSNATTNGAAGENLVNFLRGDRSLEDEFYRHRVHVLGDIITAESQYVATSNQLLDEALNPGYAAFKATNLSRTAVIYTAANDGMLHAFEASTGKELWAYIPKFVIPKLYTLADTNYANKHQYFVEGTPKVSDVYINSQWRTILVGGLNAGGAGYYALDITNPTSPKRLWDFTDANMGYTFGNPVITKQSDGNWVVILTSGYDNCTYSTTNPNCTKGTGGDGQGHMYVLDAETGTLVINPSSHIATGVGDSDDPSGLSRIVGYAPIDNFTNRIYGGDLKGNLWRFTITPGSYSKQLLATFKDADGNAQPITTKPVVSTVSGDTVVYVGTGRYLGLSDVGVTSHQSFYAVKDIGQTSSFGNPRDSAAGFIKQQVTKGTCSTNAVAAGACVANEEIRQVTASTTDTLKEKNGWILDFPTDSNEMSFTDATIYSGTLLFSTSEPIAGVSQVCDVVQPGDPKSFGYKVDYLTGGSVDGQWGVVANDLGVGIATSPRLYQTATGEIKTQTNLSTGKKMYGKPPPNPVVNPTKRLSWTESE